MNAATKIVVTLGTLAVLGIGALQSASADEGTTRENLEQYQVFANDYAQAHAPVYRMRHADHAKSGRMGAMPFEQRAVPADALRG
ncbi:hypothetical protein [Xanthobacter sp. KR7-225]|uniref:hypothetical protein n=1 Tax=Xanthobacter sp. KR7-225 TaxID=3156613 RepID=UPI0032B440A6